MSSPHCACVCVSALSHPSFTGSRLQPSSVTSAAECCAPSATESNTWQHHSHRTCARLCARVASAVLQVKSLSTALECGLFATLVAKTTTQLCEAKETNTVITTVNTSTPNTPNTALIVRQMLVQETLQRGTTLRHRVQQQQQGVQQWVQQ
jgi:hypothetical protein